MTGENQIPTEWYFITPPQEVEWAKTSNTTEIDTYGTNSPYLNYGTTKLRQLNLGDAMIEGFSAAIEIEENVLALEKCMDMVIDTGTGYASPYCWEVFAGGKSYGTYLITGVSVREEMRDASGKATRAYCDITLAEVSPYQVSSGTDITSQAIVGGVDPKFESALAAQDAAVAKNKPPAATGAGTGTATAPGTGTGTPGEAPPAAAPVQAIDPGQVAPIFTPR